jgi:tRNA pseudouridine38-40 synthase
MREIPQQHNVQNHKLIISYDGTPFGGWQIQPNAVTVQSLIEKAITTLWGERYPLQGSGRTDAGVHAHGQVAHFQAPVKFKDLNELRRALNHNLPKEIRILDCKKVSLTFHARFSAQGKEYHYLIYNHEIMNPFLRLQAFHQAQPLQLLPMQEAIQHLLGTHDFASFASNPGYARATTVRTMQAVQIKKQGPLLKIRFRANGFLYRMVRNLTGALIKVGRGRITPGDFKTILEEKKRSAAPQTAPAHGLYLMKVFY